MIIAEFKFILYHYFISIRVYLNTVCVNKLSHQYSFNVKMSFMELNSVSIKGKN